MHGQSADLRLRSRGVIEKDGSVQKTHSSVRMIKCKCELWKGSRNKVQMEEEADEKRIEAEREEEKEMRNGKEKREKRGQAVA